MVVPRNKNGSKRTKAKKVVVPNKGPTRTQVTSHVGHVSELTAYARAEFNRLTSPPSTAQAIRSVHNGSYIVTTWKNAEVKARKGWLCRPNARELYDEGLPVGYVMYHGGHYHVLALYANGKPFWKKGRAAF